MPARCWIAPEMPKPRYSLGEIVRPVWPIWKRWGRQPASTAAREAPTAAPITLASSSRITKFSGPLSPRPPDTTISASVSSGSPVDDSCLRSTSFMLSAGMFTAGFSTDAVAPACASAGRKTLGRSVAIHGVLDHVIFERSLPAYTGRVAISLPPSAASAVESAERPAPSRAASRAMNSRCRVVTGPKIACGDSLRARGRGEARGLAQHLRHHLLGCALPVVLDHAPVRAGHRFLSISLCRRSLLPAIFSCGGPEMAPALPQAARYRLLP